MAYERKTVTAQNGLSRHLKLDELSIAGMTHVRELFKRMGKRKPSESVVIRRALLLYVQALDRMLPSAWEGLQDEVLDAEFQNLVVAGAGTDCNLKPVPAACHFPSFIERLSKQMDMKIPVED
jgi:hypothetical protein